MKPIKAAVIVGIMAVASSLAYAAPAPFEKLDANKDGSLDAEEFAKAKDSGVKRTLADLDKDKNGMLSKKEYSVVLDADCE